GGRVRERSSRPVLRAVGDGTRRVAGPLLARLPRRRRRVRAARRRPVLPREQRRLPRGARGRAAPRGGRATMTDSHDDELEAALRARLDAAGVLGVVSLEKTSGGLAAHAYLARIADGS